MRFKPFQIRARVKKAFREIKDTLRSKKKKSHHDETTATNPPATTDTTVKTTATEASSTSTTLRTVLPVAVVHFEPTPVSEPAPAVTEVARDASPKKAKSETVVVAEPVPAPAPVPTPEPAPAVVAEKPASPKVEVKHEAEPEKVVEAAKVEEPKKDAPPVAVLPVVEVIPEPAPVHVEPTQVVVTEPVELKVTTPTKAVSSSKVSPSKMFTHIMELKNEFEDRATTAVLKAADAMRVQFAKFMQDPVRSLSLAQGYKQLDHAVRDLFGAVHNDEKLRKPKEDDEDIVKRRAELQAESEQLNTQRKAQEEANAEQQRRLDEVKELFASQRALLESDPQAGVDDVKKEFVEGYKSSLEGKEKEVPVKSCFLDCRPEAEVVTKLKKQIDEMKLNLTNLVSEDLKAAKEAAGNVVSFVEDVIKEEERLLKEKIEEIEAKLHENRMQADLNEAMAAARRQDAAMEVGREAMLHAVRVLGEVERAVMQMNTADFTPEQLEWAERIKSAFADRKDQYVEKANALSTNGKNFGHYHGEYKLLCDNDKHALLDNHTGEVVTNLFIPDSEPAPKVAVGM